jgi:hypothetical protein
LLFGPYRRPKLRVGQRAFCLARNADVIITGWSTAPISWPCCRRVGGRDCPGLLVEEELARALRHEAAAAIKDWWGVGTPTVWRWRKALGVGRLDAEGTRRLVQAAAAAQSARLRGRKLTPEQIERCRQSSLALNTVQYLRRRPHGRGRFSLWTDEEIALLGTAPDSEIAARLERTTDAVRAQRNLRRIRNACDRRQREHR